MSNRHLKSLKNCSISPRHILKYCCFALGAVFVVELLLFNVFVSYGYFLVRDNIRPVFNNRGQSWMEKLLESKYVKEAVHGGKAGGFVSLIQETLERVYITIPEDGSNHLKVATFGLDVSHSGESLYIYKRLARRKHFMYSRLVVDIGANDGLLSSNSFNFIQWGWDAILVEPQTTQLQMAVANLRRYNNPYRDGNQTVRFVEAIIGSKDGMVQFVKTPDAVSQEGHVLRDTELNGNRHILGSIVQVQSLKAKTFATKYEVPRYFGILSIDAEGEGNQILHDFIDLGYRPAYIIYEDLHEHRWEAPSDTFIYLANNGYKFLTKRGWNNILEHTIDLQDDTKTAA